MRIVVLGMHKSGTTLIAKCLHYSGIRMVTGVESSNYEIGNKFERKGLRELNVALADLTSSHSLAPRSRSAPIGKGKLSLLQTKMLRLIEQWSYEEVDWGFKDPRTTLTYRFWRPLCGQHRLIGIYRRPEEVVEHYWSPRRPWDMLRAVQRWFVYNSELCAICQYCEVPICLVRYDRLMHEQSEFERLSTFLGRNLNDQREPSLYRNRGNSWTAGLATELGNIFVTPSVRWLIRELDRLRLEQTG